MRRYETIVIVDPDLNDDDRASLFNRVKEIIPQQQGVLLKEDLWGTKKLAYEIKKKPRGFYARFDYCGMGPAVDEIERFFRIDDGVLKYLTVLLADEADPEKILAEIAAEEAAATVTASAAGTTEGSESEAQTTAASPVSEASAPVAEIAPAEPDMTESDTDTSEEE